jgi:hypothetical protein
LGISSRKREFTGCKSRYKEPSLLKTLFSSNVGKLGFCSDFDIDLDEAVRDLNMELDSSPSETVLSAESGVKQIPIVSEAIVTESGVFLQSLSECLSAFIATTSQQQKRKRDDADDDLLLCCNAKEAKIEKVMVPFIPL